MPLFRFRFHVRFPVAVSAGNIGTLRVESVLPDRRARVRPVGTLFRNDARLRPHGGTPFAHGDNESVAFHVRFRIALLLCRPGQKRADRTQRNADGRFLSVAAPQLFGRTHAGFYAGRLCVTAKYLSKVLRRTTGHTACFWIGEFRIKEARQLLRSTQASVAEIAERLGFPDSSFFAKFFRRHTGCSPVEFRRGNR